LTSGTPRSEQVTNSRARAAHARRGGGSALSRRQQVRRVPHHLPTHQGLDAGVPVVITPFP
jgi:hypothetical protein